MDGGQGESEPGGRRNSALARSLPAGREIDAGVLGDLSDLGRRHGDAELGTTVYVLAVIEQGSRRIRILGATEHPVQSSVVQQARNLLTDLEDARARARSVLHDRDASFTAAFDSVFQAAGIRVIRSAVQSPRMNSIMERWIGSCRRELLDRTLVWNQRHLMIVLREP